MGSFVGQNIVFPVPGVRVNAARCSVSGGLLWLSEVQDADGGHTSCMAVTDRTFDHGYFEARMMWPQGNGFGAEFWLRSLDSVAAPRPEIDFIEAHPVTNSTSTQAGPTKYQGTLHYPCGVPSPCFHQVTHDAGFPLANQWHTYGAEWIPGNRLAFYMDGVLLGESSNPITSDVLSANLALVLSFSVGASDWCCKTDATTPASASMLVDWVRWSSVKP
jgi:beta-glucanase (GH16 family)